MAGDWIKMRNNLWDDPRVARLCDMVDAAEATVVGGLYWLWAMADQHTEDGRLPGLTQRAIDRKTGIAGFAAALVTINWLRDDGPQGITIARFTEHNGTSAKRRSLDSQRHAAGKRTSQTANGEQFRTPLACDAEALRTECGQSADEMRGIVELEKRREEKRRSKHTRHLTVTWSAGPTRRPRNRRS